MPAKENGGRKLSPTFIASQLEPQMRHSAPNTKEVDLVNAPHTGMIRTLRTFQACFEKPHSRTIESNIYSSSLLKKSDVGLCLIVTGASQIRFNQQPTCRKGNRIVGSDAISTDDGDNSDTCHATG